jgi:hypothetical protein
MKLAITRASGKGSSSVYDDDTSGVNLTHDVEAGKVGMIKPGAVHLIIGDVIFHYSSYKINNPPIRLNIGSSAKENSGSPVISGRQGKHKVPSACGINTDCIWNVVERCLDVVLVVQRRSGPIGLNQ